MNDAFSMGGIESIGNFYSKAEQFFGVQRLPRDVML